MLLNLRPSDTQEIFSLSKSVIDPPFRHFILANRLQLHVIVNDLASLMLTGPLYITITHKLVVKKTIKVGSCYNCQDRSDMVVT